MSGHIMQVRVEPELSDSEVDAGGSPKTLSKWKDNAYDRVYENAERFLERNEFEKVILSLRKIPEDYPYIADVYSLMGLSYAMLDRFEDALTHFKKAAGIMPEEWSHWINMVGAHLELGDIVEAMKCVDRLNEMEIPLEMQAGMDEVRENVNRFFDDKLAAKPYLDFDKCLELESRLDAGIAHIKERDWERAIREFEYIISVDEKSEAAYDNIGLIHLFRGEFDEAGRCFRKALEIYPEHPIATMNLALLETLQEILPDDFAYSEYREYLEGVEEKLIGAYFRS